MSRAVFAAILFAVLAGCTSAPRYRAAPAETVGPQLVTRGNDVVEEAQKYVGAPYRSGGKTRAGVDCSGLVVGVYEKFGIAMPRAAEEQARSGQEVARSELQPGDLVFFRTDGTGAVSHVGIYAGNGQFIHASNRSRRVQFDRLDNRYFRRRYETARRIL